MFEAVKKALADWRAARHKRRGGMLEKSRRPRRKAKHGHAQRRRDHAELVRLLVKEGHSRESAERLWRTYFGGA